MRTIKFRAQKESDGTWVYGDLITTPIHSDCAILENGCINYAVKRETVGQYTGRQDAEGTELYEGDCIASLNNVIEWSGDCFCVNGDRPLWQWLAYKKVGNVHEKK